MTQSERLQFLNKCLLDESPQYKNMSTNYSSDNISQFRLFRSLVNIRPPKQASKEFLKIQDKFLQTAIAEKGITDINDLEPIRGNLYLWQGDITTLKCDSIVNAANSAMLGCFCPCHSCIDNAIHTFSGVQLRLDCAEIMQKQGHNEPCGTAKITPAYNLPCKHILHTVGPMIIGKLTEKDYGLLAECYRSCLSLAEKSRLSSIAFCCISTGEFHFPNDEAAKTAISTVDDFLTQTGSNIKVIFNVYKEYDCNIYKRLLG
jgi:O-acetyl-ADP-ribose deacetylase (regulator of RNase III)